VESNIENSHKYAVGYFVGLILDEALAALLFWWK
jgi:hypothetical protein